jgi:hypothetical protein
VCLGLIAVAALLDHAFRLRDRASALAAYREYGESNLERRRAKEAIRYRITQLTLPDETSGVIGNGGAVSGRLLETGLLYGRLALIEEGEGDFTNRDKHMEDAVRLLREGGDLRASPEHVRDVIRHQGKQSNSGAVQQRDEADKVRAR